MSRQDRFLITQSLLSAWQWQYDAYDPDEAHDDFIKVLNKEPRGQRKAMLNGIQFENMVTAYCNGNPPALGHEWENGILAVGDILKGAQFQVAAYKDVHVCGVPFLLYGKLDALKAGVIYDEKFSKSYEPGKYLTSPQHPMYLSCCPEARKFVYLVSNGTELYQETYTLYDTLPIEITIAQFMQYLDDTNLTGVYIDKWKARD